MTHEINNYIIDDIFKNTANSVNNHRLLTSLAAPMKTLVVQNDRICLFFDKSDFLGSNLCN